MADGSHRKVLKHLKSFHGLFGDDLSSARQVDPNGSGVLFIPPSKQLVMWQRSAIVAPSVSVVCFQGLASQSGGFKLPGR